jgi:hypothetical protein
MAEKNDRWSVGAPLKAAFGPKQSIEGELLGILGGFDTGAGLEVRREWLLRSLSSERIEL